MSLTTMILTSLGLGMLHGFDPDHVMIVTNFVSQNPQPRKAVRFGFNFGIGHSSAVLVFSIIALALKLVIPNSIAFVLESAAGVALMVLGTWVLWSLVKRRRIGNEGHHHEHSHGFGHNHRHPHGHAFQHEHAHEPSDKVKQHGATVVGMITGLAGTASVMLFGPVLLAPSILWAAAFIAVYGMGVIFSMSVYGYLISRFYLLVSRSQAVSEIIMAVTGCASIVLGILWTTGII